MELGFFGGVKDNITGSCTLVTITQRGRVTQFLIDAGDITGSSKDPSIRAQELLKHFNPAKIKAVVATHIHMDHIGIIPMLIKYGFRGDIFCTRESKNLLVKVMLTDGAKIKREEGLRFANKARKEKAASKNTKHYKFSSRGNRDKNRMIDKAARKNNHCHFEPLYTMEHVNLVSGLIKNGGIDYNQWTRIDDNIDLKFYRSGHVLGGGIVIIRIKDKNKYRYCCFSGDLGRKDDKLLSLKYPKEKIDFMFMDSTYGGEIHAPRKIEEERLVDIVSKAHSKNQQIIVPCFSLRTPKMIYDLTALMEKKLIPEVPICVYSPMGSKVVKEYADLWAKTGTLKNTDNISFNPFDPRQNKYLKIVETEAEIEKYEAMRKTVIYLAGAGMCHAGPIRKLLEDNLNNSEAIILLVGYMTKNTLGRKLFDGEAFVKMHGKEIEVKAEINILCYSDHADEPELIRYAKHVLSNLESPKDSITDKHLFIVHGEGSNAIALKKNLSKSLPSELGKKTTIVIPELNDKLVFQLN